jgi:Leucine-rich repeat (LRR) protein
MRLTRPAKPPERTFSVRELWHIARNPSRRAPRAADVLTPQAASRGVPGDVVSGRAFISLGGAWRLRDVRLVAVQPFLGELVRCAHLSHLHRLDLSGNRIGDLGAAELAASPFVADLRELVLSGNDVSKPPDMPDLTALDVSNNPLRTFEFPRGLRRLAASGCGLPVGSLAPLTSLTELDASFSALGPPGADALAELSLPLRRLDLSFNDIESAGAEVLAFDELVSLNLRANRITATDGLAESPHFGNVEELDLAVNPIGDRGVVALMRGEAFGSLTRLDVSNCGITDVGVAGLCESGTLGGLRELSLAWNPVGDAAVRALVACPDLAGLRSLDLTGTRMTLAGAVALAESLHLHLRTLALGENHRLPPGAVRMLGERIGTITA